MKEGENEGRSGSRWGAGGQSVDNGVNREEKKVKEDKAKKREEWED